MRSLTTILLGVATGYVLMSFINSQWPIALAIAAAIYCSIFVNSGNGAVFAIIPLVKRRLTGQIAGMAGAYGNVGGVIFLTVLSFVSPASFFITIAVFALVVFAASVLFLQEPAGHMAETMPDGSVQIIEVK